MGKIKIRDEQKGIIFIAIIFIIVIGLTIFFSLTLRTNVVKEYIKDSDVVIDGLYSWDEYLVLKNEFPNIILLSVVVDKNIRYDRLKIRPNRNYTYEEAMDRDLNEIEKLSKGGPICYADYYILNNTTIEDEINSLKNILNKIK